MVRLVGVEPTTGKSPADFKPAAYANFATAAPGDKRGEIKYITRVSPRLERREKRRLPSFSPVSHFVQSVLRRMSFMDVRYFAHGVGETHTMFDAAASTYVSD